MRSDRRPSRHFRARSFALAIASLGFALGLACVEVGAQGGADVHASRRAGLVQILRTQGIRDGRVLAAIGAVPRHLFVPPTLAARAYENRPLPIGHEQTISQPYVVAIMTELAELSPPCRVLEVGTGSGYQAAVLDALGCEVWSIEIVEALGREAEARLARLGYQRVHVRIGDGYAGWPEHAPFDAVIVTAAPPAIPEPLRQQLRIGGRLVAPVGSQTEHQVLVVVTRTGEQTFERRSALGVRFVPMTGRAQRRP